MHHFAESLVCVCMTESHWVILKPYMHLPGSKAEMTRIFKPLERFRCSKITPEELFPNLFNHQALSEFYVPSALKNQFLLHLLILQICVKFL